MTWVVLVADTDIDAHGHAEPHVVGPFDTEAEATIYAYGVGRYLVSVLPVTSVTQAATEGVPT